MGDKEPEAGSPGNAGAGKLRDVIGNANVPF